jgi:hypothetical protein
VKKTGVARSALEKRLAAYGAIFLQPVNRLQFRNLYPWQLHCPARTLDFLQAPGGGEFVISPASTFGGPQRLAFGDVIGPGLYFRQSFSTLAGNFQEIKKSRRRTQHQRGGDDGLPEKTLHALVPLRVIERQYQATPASTESIAAGSRSESGRPQKPPSAARAYDRPSIR